VSVRVTQSMISTRVLSDLQKVTQQLAKTQEQISSGKQLTQPSDDPFGASRSLQLRAEVARTQQFERNVDDATSWQTTADTALSNVNDAVGRVRDLLVQGANDTQGPAGRQAIANEVNQLIDSIKTEANTQYAGVYVFSGSATLTQPYQLGSNDAYAGNTNSVNREIGPGIQVGVNQIGSSVIGDSSTGLLSTLRKIVTDLQSGNTNALGTTDLKALDTDHDTVSNAQSMVGALANRLDSAKSRLQQLEDNSTKLLSNVEDADMAQVMINYSTQSAVYQAALRAGANIIQPSLMDFMH
jgi:flagellar hook-associated protein 3 FlgL